MVILTAFAIGLLTTALRSVICYALAGCLVLVVFGAAALVSAGPVSFMPLLFAILGYNAGIAAAVGSYLVADRLRTARSESRAQRPTPLR
ncbi:thiol:disulfide interchange protein [Pararhizobium capsulatum DSM 1112]|uniref:Thiol:disulfide interchange protein n=1 Tax=Pararhizobium capsulatum DSM 1112 TaxID=1121113 RepID=A0ABU0BJK2_9HYPH|nr:hypothetical protein [Pararhizobium capsulatum]MDQ0318430.1 thiol:disulfide interchange protein [Pararhizobium capsulatum DSM 1112]